MALPESLIERLETSFALFEGREQQLIDTFYGTLFETAPEVRSLFPDEMSAQKQKLLASLALVVKHLRNLEAITPTLKQMGARHIDYGAEDAHYPVVRDAMVTAMSRTAGRDWTDQFTRDWNAALDLVSSVMIEGAQEVRKQAA